MQEGFQPQDYHILVIDDDMNIALMARMYLEHRGFTVSCAYDGPSGLRGIEESTVHLVVLDLMLPGIDGFELCRQIRRDGDVPVLIVTARGDSTDKLRGFELGADDYLVKPFDPNELVARTISLLRRTYQPKVNIPPVSTLQFGDVVMDTKGHTVSVGSESVILTPREYQLLLMLAEHTNQVLSRQQLLDFVWGIDYEGEDRVVDVFVKRLRQKLGQHSGKWTIVTVRGEGYKLKIEG